jgi:hypothetical protein
MIVSLAKQSMETVAMRPFFWFAPDWETELLP